MKANELIGENIKKWREFKELKQEVLAKKLNITSSTLSRIETGKADITVSRLQEIAEILDVHFSMLFSSPQQIIKNYGLLNAVVKNGLYFNHSSEQEKEFNESSIKKY